MFTAARLRRIFYALLFVAAVVAVLGAICVSRAIAQRAGGGWAPNAFEHDGATIPESETGPTPPPCNGQLITILDERFDNVNARICLLFGWLSMGSIRMAFYGKLQIPDCRAHPLIQHLMPRGSMIRL
jgi:hypothetical protein